VRATPFPVRPTPDDGVRKGLVDLLDEATRPTGPARDPDRSYTARDLASAQHLIDIHSHLRIELNRICELVRQVSDGSLTVNVARSQINLMALRSDRWTVGAHCASYCYLLTAHHTLEDQAMFPGLRQVDSRLGPVLDRLAEEHEIISQVLTRLDAALIDFVTESEAGDGQLHKIVDQLSDALLSHLSYEERELAEPLARAHLF
jgi:iron-sulfur cluster repair protein YtfE (RIC family)